MDNPSQPKNPPALEAGGYGYAIKPLQPLPKYWFDAIGPIRVMCEPHAGYIMARRHDNSTPFVLSVRELLGGKFTPILPKPRTNVRQRVAEIKAAHDAAVRDYTHGE